MDGLMLLREAQAAGLSVYLDGDKLVVRGPRSAEPLALRLLEHKHEVVAAIRVAEPVCRLHPRSGAIDMPIHGGRSIRRDCAECGRFIAFTRWREPSIN